MSKSDFIWKLFKKNKYTKARKFIEKELRKLDSDDHTRHWWLSRLGTTYYEQRDYQQATVFFEEAKAITPTCPLVLWDIACTYEMLADHAKAVQIFKTLVGVGVHEIAHGDCGEGIKYARSLINDCYYRLATCHRTMKMNVGYFKYCSLFLGGLYHGDKGIYGRKYAKKLLKAIKEG